jgi:outer membrane biosynthesis protein TonB
MDRVPLHVSISEHQRARADRPPLPLHIFDTGYPQMCIDQGAVIMELTVNEAGDVEDVRSIINIPSLGGAAETEVKSWKFYPAMSGGKPVRGQAVVVISFVHPAL